MLYIRITIVQSTNQGAQTTSIFVHIYSSEENERHRYDSQKMDVMFGNYNIHPDQDHWSQFAELSHQIQLEVKQKRFEDSVRDHEQREADIINFLPDATFAINSEGTIIAWNRAMEKLTGMSSENI